MCDAAIWADTKERSNEMGEGLRVHYSQLYFCLFFFVFIYFYFIMLNVMFLVFACFAFVLFIVLVLTSPCTAL